MSAKIFAVSLLCFGAALSEKVQPCVKDPSAACVAKFLADNNAGRCLPSKGANLTAYPAHQVFDAPFFNVSIISDVVIRHIDKAAIQEFSVDEASGKAVLKLQLNYHATGHANISIHTTKPDTVVTTNLVEDIPGLIFTIQFKDYKKLTRDEITSSIPKGVLGKFSHENFLSDGSTNNPAVAAFVQSLKINRPKMAAITNAVLAKTVSAAFVDNKICNLA